MEERLFWIGLVMGGFAWATRYFGKTGKLDTRKATAIWHAAFYALAGFAVTLVGVLSIESRARSIPISGGLLSEQEIGLGLVGGALLGAWGFWSAWRQGTRAEKRRGVLNEDLEWAETVFSAVILASLLMYFVVQAFKIPSGSMESTLQIGDHLFVNKFIYGARIPLTAKRVLRVRDVQRKDIIVFMFPSDDINEIHCGSQQYGKDFIKRVIGLPGDKVEVRDGMVYVNDKPLGPEPYTQYLDAVRHAAPLFAPSPEEYQKLWQERKLDQVMVDGMRDFFGPVVVPPGDYFVMGDNRDRSCDGRFWGPVPNRYLKGKAWIIYWPPSRMGRIS